MRRQALSQEISSPHTILEESQTAAETLENVIEMVEYEIDEIAYPEAPEDGAVEDLGIEETAYEEADEDEEAALAAMEELDEVDFSDIAFKP